MLVDTSKNNPFSRLEFLEASDSDNPQVAACNADFVGDMDGPEYKDLLSAIARRGRQAFSAKSARGKFKKLQAASIELQNDNDFKMALLEHTTILKSDIFCTNKIDSNARCIMCSEPIRGVLCQNSLGENFHFGCAGYPSKLDAHNSQLHRMRSHKAWHRAYDSHTEIGPLPATASAKFTSSDKARHSMSHCEVQSGRYPAASCQTGHGHCPDTSPASYGRAQKTIDGLGQSSTPYGLLSTPHAGTYISESAAWLRWRKTRAEVFGDDVEPWTEGWAFHLIFNQSCLKAQNYLWQHLQNGLHYQHGKGYQRIPSEWQQKNKILFFQLQRRLPSDIITRFILAEI